MLRVAHRLTKTQLGFTALKHNYITFSIACHDHVRTSNMCMLVCYCIRTYYNNYTISLGM